MVHRALDQDKFILSQFFNTCSALGFVNYAYSIFTSNPNPNIYLYNTLISIFSRQHHSSKDAIFLYKQARAIGLYHDTYSIPFVLNAVNSLITCRQIHCEAILTGLNNDVHVATSVVHSGESVFSGYWCFPENESVEVGAKPDEVMMLAVLSACAHLGEHELGEWIHSYIIKHGLRRTVSLNNTLIDMYAKSGNVKKAVELFESMETRSVVTWSTVISALAVNEYGREALNIHAGFVEEGRLYFKTMEEKHGISPDIRHYDCMVGLLGRAGYLDEAANMVETMPFEAYAAIWGSLLAAARNQGHVELGEQALQHLTEVEPHNSGNYSLASNTYAALGRWSEARVARMIMRDTGVKKLLGDSFIKWQEVFTNAFCELL
ncbi:hypothetical protein RND71_040532 [Anisodus tanguticus]|uniref:Pentatricopeptide repeat-containing protein n=1 Tax=Anisodus tanguticus TaxID=243964 RepID=A0AAE1UVT5_9SOLA|nr:hypothetical protein RND71_040532 [Anisodus tanguticus]